MIRKTMYYLVLGWLCVACAIRPTTQTESRCYAIATYYGKKGLINRQGEWVIKPKYNYLYLFNDKLLEAYGEGKGYLINFNDEVVRPIPDTVSIGKVNSNKLWVAWVRLSKEKYSKAGFINDKIEWIIRPKYSVIKYFSEGMAAVEREGLWGFVNEQGKEVIAPKYEKVASFKNGLAIAQKDSLYGLINRQGKWVVPNRYLGISPQQVQGHIVVKDTTSKWGVMSEAGQWVLPPQYEYVQLLGANRAAVWQLTHPRKTSLHFARKRTLVALPSGKPIVSLANDNFIYPFNRLGLAKMLDDADLFWDKINESIRDYNQISDRLTAMSCFADKNEREFALQGLIDTTGKIVIPAKYREIGELNEGLVTILFDDGYGFVKPDGSQAFAGRFADVRPFRQGWARVLDTADSLVFKRDKQGGRIPIPLPPHVGLLEAEKMANNRWGFINKEGKWMIKPQFDEVSDFFCIKK